MSETWPPAFEVARWRAESRMMAYGESDPAMRMELLNGLLAEGDHDAAPFATQAMLEQADTDDDKMHGKIHALGETLARQKLFTEVDSVVEYLQPRTKSRALQITNTALENGYPGPDNSYLSQNFDDALVQAAASDEEPSHEVFSYLSAVGAYGKDILDEHLPHGRLLALAMALTRPGRHDFRYNNIVYHAAQAGKLALATAAKERVLDPYWKALSGLYIAREVVDTDRGLAGTLADEASEKLDAVYNCDGSCGRVGCDPGLDGHEIEVKIALVRAKRGELDLARVAIGPPAGYVAREQAEVWAEIYKQDGQPDTRHTALMALLTRQNYMYRPELTAGIMRELARGDLRWGHFLPSPFETDEPAPALCWELNRIFGQLTEYEVKGPDGFSELERNSMVMLGFTADDLVRESAESRIEHRDYSMAEMAKIVSGLGSVQTAQHLVGLIEYPVPKVRALAGMAKALEDAG